MNIWSIYFKGIMMSNPKIGIIIVYIIFCACSNEKRNIPDDWLKVRVDPTMELFCTIHRLARTGVDETHELPKYIKDIENHFGSFENHRAVSIAKKLWETHRINISALSTLVVYLGDPPELVPRYKLDPLPS